MKPEKEKPIFFMPGMPRYRLLPLLILFLAFTGTAQEGVKETTVGHGWAGNSVNAVIFRKNALVTHAEEQFIAYYDPEGYLTLGKRKLGDTHWNVKRTPYKGNTADAHNTISIAVDGKGYLHVSWDHHDTPLRYARSREPLGLDLGEESPMTGKEEGKVTYPEFYDLPGGNLLFFYRSGGSGRGNMVVNTYNVKTGQWTQLHRNLIDGEGQRSAYWQACVDRNGTIHLSWVWRETWDVSSNHDLCYARSCDGGVSWEKSTGEKYRLPLKASTAEYARKIPEGSGLINQTSMAADKQGKPYIATYWKEEGIPRYQVVYRSGGQWKNVSADFRNTPFELGGGGTKRIPLSRPQLLVREVKGKPRVYLLFRDEERDNRVSVAGFAPEEGGNWKIRDLTAMSVGQWEPSYDIALWENRKQLHIFVQEVEQADGEGIADRQATDVRVLEVPLHILDKL